MIRESWSPDLHALCNGKFTESQVVRLARLKDDADYDSALMHDSQQ